ncbi:MAG: hypothetical protein Crog4KO_21160 [Crocinitomicaceae bacterium]
MKEPVNIDQLFQKAATTPVHTSFDATKETFAQSLANRGKGGSKSFRSLKWIPMTTLILGGITAIAIAFFPAPKTANNPTTESTAKVAVKTTSSTEEVTTESEEVLLTELEPIDSKGALATLSIPVFTHYLLQPQKMLLDPHQLIYDFAHDRRMDKDTLEVPQLTEKAIAENDKRKRKMIKALAKRDKDHYAYIPSGTTEYKGVNYSVQAFYAQTKEVTNLEYRTFLNDLLIQGRNDEYIKAYPQEEQWSQQIKGDALSMEKLYFTHPGYDDYPVVNISREGAEMYCSWLTQETNNSKFVDDDMWINDLRLPQRLEWTYAARSGISEIVYPWGCDSTKNEDGCYLANYKPDSLNHFADGAFITAKTGTYTPNPFGLYNISGNVAEMVYGPTEFEFKSDLIERSTEAGTAGGGWMDDEETLKIEGDDPYAKIIEAHPNIGFRPVMTFLRKGSLVGQKGN